MINNPFIYTDPTGMKGGKGTDAEPFLIEEIVIKPTDNSIAPVKDGGGDPSLPPLPSIPPGPDDPNGPPSGGGSGGSGSSGNGPSSNDKPKVETTKKEPLIPGIYPTSVQNIGYHMRNADRWWGNASRAALSGLVLALPPVGLTNDIKNLTTGKDIYGNEANNLDKALSILGIATFGVSSGLIEVSKPVVRGLSNIPTALTGVITIIVNW